MSKATPKTTDAKCKEYDTTIRSCECTDKTRKKGSYTLKGLNVCKHQAHVINRAYKVFADFNTTQHHELTEKPFCECKTFISNDFAGCPHITLQAKIEQYIREYLTIDLRASERSSEVLRISRQVSDDELVARLQA